MIHRPEDKGPEWAHDRAMADEAHMAELFTQTAKALGVLNAGGAVAMLGLLQALVQKAPQFCVYKPFGLGALAVFVIGGLVTALTFFARWQRASWQLVEGTEVRRKLWYKIAFALLLTSVATFAIGCLVAGIGIARL